MELKVSTIHTKRVTVFKGSTFTLSLCTGLLRDVSSWLSSTTLFAFSQVQPHGWRATYIQCIHDTNNSTQLRHISERLQLLAAAILGVVPALCYINLCSAWCFVHASHSSSPMRCILFIFDFQNCTRKTTEWLQWKASWVMEKKKWIYCYLSPAFCYIYDVVSWKMSCVCQISCSSYLEFTRHMG